MIDTHVTSLRGAARNLRGFSFSLPQSDGNCEMRPYSIPDEEGQAKMSTTRITTVLGPDFHIQGTLRGTAGLRIEGTLDGAINTKGPVVIAESAKVTADIEAEVVSVSGQVNGNIKATKVEILATGRIYGNLVTCAFTTEEGALLRGTVTLQDEI